MAIDRSKIKNMAVTKKAVAAGGLALGLGCIGLLANASIAAAAPSASCNPTAECTGTYPKDPSNPPASSGYGTRDTATNPGTASIDPDSR